MKKLGYFLLCRLLMAIVILLAVGWLVIGVKASTGTPEIFINEIMYNPIGSDGGHEWIEVVNVSTSTSYAIDNNWRFNDGSNHQLSIILGDEIIEPNEYIILADNHEIFLQDYPDYTGSLVDTVMSLNNTEDTLSLSVDSGQTFFATTTYQSAWGASDNGKSLARIDFIDVWEESSFPGGTPGSLNQILNGEGATSTEEEIPEEDEETPTSTDEIIEEQTPTTTEEVLEENNTAYSDLIIINEVLPNPSGSDNQDEFIELYNRDSAEVDLNGWQLSDATDKKFTISSGDYQSTVIKPYGYFVVYRDQSGIALNNNGDKVRLYQPDGTLLAEVEYTGSVKEGFSYSKKEGSWIWTSSPTPGNVNLESRPSEPVSCPGSTVIYLEKKVDEANKVPEGKEVEIDFDASKYQGLTISEFIPDPLGSDDGEWIELANFGLQSLDLTGWLVDDAEGGSWSFKLPAGAKIEPGGYLIITKEESKLALNNNGDEVRLISPDEQIFQAVVYQSAKEGFSYNYDQINNEWYWSDEISPGQENVVIGSFNNQLAELEQKTIEAEFPFQQIFEIKELSKGTKAKTIGQLISPPQALGQNIIYIADPAVPYLGIQLYSSSHDFSQFKIGDLIEVEGMVSEIQGEKRINLAKGSEIKIIDYPPLPQPELIAIGDLSDDLIGSLIYVSGELVEHKGNDYYLDDGTGELRVYIKKDTGITKPKVEEGYYLDVVGILSLTKLGYRLLPRFQSDINAGQILSEEETTKLSDEEIVIEAEDKESKVKNVLSVSGGSLLLLLISLIVKLKFLK